MGGKSLFDRLVEVVLTGSISAGDRIAILLALEFYLQRAAEMFKQNLPGAVREANGMRVYFREQRDVDILSRQWANSSYPILCRLFER
jgi:hypothetical protein